MAYLCSLSTRVNVITGAFKVNEAEYKLRIHCDDGGFWVLEIKRVYEGKEKKLFTEFGCLSQNQAMEKAWAFLKSSVPPGE